VEKLKEEVCGKIKARDAKNNLTLEKED